MVLDIAIDKIESGLYRAAALSGAVEVTTPGVYSSIEEAIRTEAAAVPSGFAHFANVTYGGASSGTIPLPVLATNATEITDRLVAIVAEMHRVHEKTS